MFQALLRRAPTTAALLLVLPGALAAQSLSSSRTVWLSYGGDHRLGARTALLLDLSGRGGAMDAAWRQYMVRPGIALKLGRSVRVGAGYAVQHTTALLEDPTSERVVEHRAWQMVQLGHGVSVLALSHRLRLEQRWQRTHTGATGAADEEREYANRVRYALKIATAPDVLPGRLQASVSEELFSGFGGSAGRPELDQARTTLAVTMPLRPTLRLELGYINQAMRAERVLAVKRHALQVGVISTAALLR